MNIMFLIFSFNIGGIERQLVDMCNIMSEKGHHVSLCVINQDYTESLFQELRDSVEVICLGRTPASSSMLTYMWKLAAIVKQNRIQILHCQGINCVLFSALARIVSPGTKILNTVHDSGNYSSYSSRKIFLQNMFCDMTIAISHSVEAEILSRRVPAEKVVTIFNAVDTDRFRFRERNYASLDKASVRICSVARFFPKKKGQDLLAEAVMRLAASYPNIHCTFAGAADTAQQDTLDRLQAEIHSRQMDSHFSFPGNVDDVPSLLYENDIFVLPSRYEGFGISLIEAMSTGMVCVASDLDGPSEIICEPHLGILFRPGDADALEEALRQAIECCAEYDPRAIADYVSQHFSIQSQADAHLQLFASLLSGSSSTGSE